MGSTLKSFLFYEVRVSPSTQKLEKLKHEWVMKQIDRGVGFSELASLISETWGCTLRNARHVVSLAH